MDEPSRRAGETMRAMIFEGVGQPLRLLERPIPRPGPGQLLLRVRACAVCRTDLHLLDGEVSVPSPPRILGHQIVGTVVPDAEPGAGGAKASRAEVADTERSDAGGGAAGVPWLGWTDASCKFCTSGRENLCPNARFTGRDID